MDADELKEFARERALRDLPPPGLLARLTTFFPLWEHEPLVHDLIQRTARFLAGRTAGADEPVYLLDYVALDELDAEHVTEFRDPERELPGLLRPLRLRSCSIRGKLGASTSWHWDTAWWMNVDLRGAEYGERWPTRVPLCHPPPGLRAPRAAATAARPGRAHTRRRLGHHSRHRIHHARL
jgi:hypothetical protein